jgi:hypothetical protein
VATVTALVIAGVAMLLAVVAAVWLKRIEMLRPAKGALLPPAGKPGSLEAVNLPAPVIEGPGPASSERRAP